MDPLGFFCAHLYYIILYIYMIIWIYNRYIYIYGADLGMLSDCFPNMMHNDILQRHGILGRRRSGPWRRSQSRCPKGARSWTGDVGKAIPKMRGCLTRKQGDFTGKHGDIMVTSWWNMVKHGGLTSPAKILKKNVVWPWQKIMFWTCLNDTSWKWMEAFV